MAFDYGFGPGPVIDPSTGELVTSATGQVYAAAEGGDALLVRQGAAETTNVQAGTDGMVQQFFADVPRVFVEFPGVSRFELVSYLDLIAQSQEARDAAVAAQGAAEDARDAAQQAGGGGAGSGILTLPVGSDTSALPEGTVFGFYTPPAEGTSVELVGYKITTASTATDSIVLDPSTPSGGDAIAPGDAMVAVVAINAPVSGQDAEPPAGWTQIRGDLAVPIGTMEVAVFVRIRQAGDTSYTFSLNTGTRSLNAALMWVRGATATLSEWIIGDSKTREDLPLESTTCTAPAISVSQAPLRVLALSFERTSASESSVDWSWSAGEEWFLGLADGSAITTIAVASKVVTSTGTSDVATCTYPNPQSANGWAFQLGIPAGN